MNNVVEVVKMFFGYIDIIKRNGVSLQYFNEMKNISKIQYDYRIKTDLMTELSDIVNKMSHFHLDHVLSADYYYGRYSEKTVR